MQYLYFCGCKHCGSKRHHSV